MSPLHLISPEQVIKMSLSMRLPERRSSTASQACPRTQEAGMGEPWQEKKEEEGKHHRVGNNTSIWNQDEDLNKRPDFHLVTVR